MNKYTKKNIFDGSCHDYLMRNNSYSVGFNMPEALEGESTHSLPPYANAISFLEFHRFRI